MRKIDKKIDKQLCKALTYVCEHSLKRLIGFQWLTHLVDYNNFPRSLKIICVFDTNDNVASFIQSPHRHELNRLIQSALFECDILIDNILSHIAFDTEENCIAMHKGNWAARLERH